MEENKIEKSIPDKITDKMIEKLSESEHFSAQLIGQLAEVDLSNVEAVKQLLLNQQETDENTEAGN